MHVAVIGAGAAGLCAARHLTAPNSGFTCKVFEQTERVGGTWVYTETTGKDKYGLPLSSSMYKNLRTNLPKENMEFPGFPFLNSKSFVTADTVLQYLEDYANYFNIHNHIQFLHHVKHVVPKGEKWEITTINLPEMSEALEEFDAVIVCNGRNSVPHMGSFPGISEFEGEVKHSHTYKTPEPFINKTILICGGGPSGQDISYDLSHFALKVYFSHKKEFKSDAFPENIEHVPVVKIVKKDHVVFEDGTCSGNIDVILICTGYKYSFPFLAPECGITIVDDKFVQPLYKQIININYPTMGFIGIPFRSLLIPLFDYQVRFFLKTLSAELKMCTKEVMLAEFSQDLLKKQEQGVHVRKYHDLSQEMQPYIENLAELAKCEHLPPVVYSIYETTTHLRESYLAKYREAVFEVKSNEEFVLHFDN